MTLENDIDPTAFGFAKMKYAAIERERRWLCDKMPEIAASASETYLIDDLYITGTQLRLRDVTDPDGAPVWPRLTRKVEIDASHRLITSIYLDKAELELFRHLPGQHVQKTRTVVMVSDQRMAVDAFTGTLQGLILAEAEFADDEAMNAFSPPRWVTREVTHEPLFSGGNLSALSEEAAKTLVRRLFDGN